ncbi:hypothetical protein BCIN_09g05720 [Botrytis cinerea B05.10]|uniref:Uncharacterized protein n=1 Tax=Botryotinia fuckeliana (strain B05.10) TaxID=332648 RepID=A0A384JTT1_BOTFB|nr:hypothetical protein BCIN_09g05720 [Botrytis cinerea B05.10]ATZ53797.1 hypothetical protein BCIN_09g05720 [Botrytis cinerea B05.10]
MICFNPVSTANKPSASSKASTVPKALMPPEVSKASTTPKKSKASKVSAFAQEPEESEEEHVQEIEDLNIPEPPPPRAGTKRKSRNDSDFEKLKSQFLKLTPEKMNELLQDTKAIEQFTQVKKDIGLKIKKSLDKYEDGKWVAKVEPGSSPAKKRKTSKALTRKQRPAVSKEIIMDS